MAAALGFLLLAAWRAAVGRAGAPAYPQPLATEPNPPTWPETVRVFGPEDQEGQDLGALIDGLQGVLNNMTEGQFSSQRLALLFKPGVYNVSIRVGYYVQVLGLGERVEDVTFVGPGGVYCLAMGDIPDPGSLNNFWRGAENFQHNGTWGMWWAVSQAAPLRRIHVARDLSLHDGKAWASGGFMADMLVDGDTLMGGQQQWFTRNSKLNTPDSKVMHGSWSLVFVGTEGAPPSAFPSAKYQGAAYTNEPVAPVIAEKPFITIGSDGRYTLQVPPVAFRSVGPSFGDRSARAAGRAVPFEQVFVAMSGVHSTADIQAKLSLGYHVVFAPGLFHLTSTLLVTHAGQVLLGIGMATLLPPADGSPCLRVAAGVPGVRLAGLLFQAAATEVHMGEIDQLKATSTAAVSTLLEWGELGVHDAGDPADPGVMSDLFLRVGGPGNDTNISVDVMLRVHSGNVIGDNLWIWRADHTEGGHKTVPPEYSVRHGLEVLGDDVTMYGLFVEHTLEDLTVWKGEGGAVYFYQSELPYGIEGIWNHSGYLVDQSVRSHVGFGLGVYSFFRDHPARVEAAIRAPATDGVRFVNSFTRYLTGDEGILHVLNDEGPAATKRSPLARVYSSLPWSSPSPKRRTVVVILYYILEAVCFLILMLAVVAVWECCVRRRALAARARWSKAREQAPSSGSSSDDESGA